MSTLLERALASRESKGEIKSKGGATSVHSLKDRLALALAYANKEISLNDINDALGTRNTSASTIGSAIITAARQGLIRIVAINGVDPETAPASEPQTVAEAKA